MGIIEGIGAWVVVSVAFAAVIGKVLHLADRHSEIKAVERLRAAGF